MLRRHVGMSLLYIGQQLSIYVGLFLFTVGLIGNGINIFIFLNKQSYRTTPCIFYFLIGSISNTIFVLLGLANRIQVVVYGSDFSSVSTVWCKVRLFLTTASIIISLTCLCFSAIDQFLVTSKSRSIRNLSRIKSAHRIVFFAVSFWLLHGIMMFLFYDVSPIRKLCVIVNPTFSVYAVIYVLFFWCIIPLLIITIFGLLTYRNIQKTLILVDRNVDRQLIKMTLITANVIKNNDQKLIESFIGSMASLLYNVFNCVCPSILFFR